MHFSFRSFADAYTPSGDSRIQPLPFALPAGVTVKGEARR